MGRVEMAAAKKTVSAGFAATFNAHMPI